MSWIGAAFQGAGATVSAFAGAKQARDQNKKIKNALSDYQYKPYSGYRPPQIDRPGFEYLRPTQDLNQKTVMEGSQGINVGFDPARRSSAQALLESRLSRGKEDDIRAANGRLASSGLSGNARAAEALAGRVDRDYGRTLGEETNILNIEDLTAAHDDRENARGRLFDLNNFNFGQENTVADFDLNQWKAEETAKQGRTGIALDAAGMYRNPYSVAGSTFGSSLTNLGSQLTGGGGGGGGGSQPQVQPATGATSTGMNFQGQGLQPTSSSNTSNAYMNYLAQQRGKSYTR